MHSVVLVAEVDVHSQNKALLDRFLREVAAARPAEVTEVLAAYCHKHVVWELFHPFNTLRGVGDVAANFWRVLTGSFPDYELRLGLILGGEFDGRHWVSTLGHAMGSFEHAWLGIRPTHGLTFLRFGMNATISNGLIERAYVLLDVVDLMRQADFYPFRRMPGSSEAWPFPPCTATIGLQHGDERVGAETLRVVREMQASLGTGIGLQEYAATIEHSPHWHPHMNWYGPAGIGSTRGQRGFEEYHCALFIDGFPDLEDGPDGHYVQLADGRYSVTSGWPSLVATHLGPGWLGLAPTGRKVEMRVADWYRADEHGLLIDNWVMIDIPHIVEQMGFDILADMRHFAEPSVPRWPR